MLLSFISGIVTGFVFTISELSFLSFFSLVPLLFLIKTGNYGFKHGFLYGLSLNLMSMLFMFYMHPLDFLGINNILSFVLVLTSYLGVCFIEGALWGILFLLFSKCVKSIWLFPVFYAISEFLLSIGSMGLTFSNIYLPFYENTAFIQIARIVGGHGITIIVLYINLFIMLSYLHRKLRYAVVAALIFLINISCGYLRINYYKDDGLNKKITLVQGNISSNEKWAAENMYTILRTYKELTLEAKNIEKSEIFIWPETVVPVAIDENHNVYKDIIRFAKENKIHIITGAFIKENNNIYNSIIVFDKEGRKNITRYDKRHLIPFAEYNPFAENKIKKGKEGTVIDTEIGEIGGLVCIDSAYPYLTYETMKNNPDYLVVLSNDSWFKSSFGVYNHYGHSVFRAIESGKYILRCANTGITSIITPTGETMKKILPQRKGYITYEK